MVGPAMRSESDRHNAAAHGGQAQPLRPAVRSRVVHLRSADIFSILEPATSPTEDVELATHNCGGVSPPTGVLVRTNDGTAAR